MAKKPSFPAKPCPKCGKPIHIKKTKHEECGWVATAAAPSAASAAPSAPKKMGRPRKAMASKAGGITVEEIAAVKSLVDSIGAEKVRDLARVLGR